MPTIKKIIEGFVEENGPYAFKGNLRCVLLGSEKYSFIKQDDLIRLLDRNIIKTTKKEDYNIDIALAINDSLKKVKAFKSKVFHKEIYDEFVQYINKNYGFKVDISNLNEQIFETSEERYVYLLRQTERENSNGKRMTLTEIADDLGFTRRQLEIDIKKMTEQGFKLLGFNIKLVDEKQSILKMESTPHPLILMQNISQLVVILEGLRSMEKIDTYRNSANSTAVDIWNQLTEYAI